MLCTRKVLKVKDSFANSLDMLCHVLYPPLTLPQWWVARVAGLVMYHSFSMRPGGGTDMAVQTMKTQMREAVSLAAPAWSKHSITNRAAKRGHP